MIRPHPAPRMAESRSTLVLAAFLAAIAPSVHGGETLQWSGFASLRGTTEADNPLESDPFAAQVQAGLDWSPSPVFLAHVHLLARTDDGDSVRGHVGTPEAYVEAHVPAGGGRARLRGGAFFLATSRENVDALWENAYAVSSSALNSWFGEELRPIGLDVSWVRAGATVGATVFRGNDTFGALPLAPGWSLHDRWTVLGQKVRTEDGLYASVSADTDDRLGWSARAGWSSHRLSVLFTHIDNRSKGIVTGDFDNWKTRFEVLGFDYKRGDWTVAGETGWGPTVIVFATGSAQSDLRASYLLVSRRVRNGRATVRFDEFTDGETDGRALTLAGFWSPRPAVTIGIELSAGGGERRGLGDLRYRFAGW